MQISDDMVEEAFKRALLCEGVQISFETMRAALEAALGVKRVLKSVKCNYPECDGGPSTGYCHNDCRIACIEELADALKIARIVIDDARSPNTCDYIDATLEKWGLK